MKTKEVNKEPKSDNDFLWIWMLLMLLFVINSGSDKNAESTAK